MKILTKSIVLITLTCSSIVFANESNQFTATNQSLSTKICITAAQGDRLKLSKALKNSGLSKRYVAEKMQCNDLSFVAFVEQYGKNAEKINNFITHGEYADSQVVANVAAR